MRTGRHDRRGQAGFSLIELLITVVVLGIIAAIALPALLNALDKSKQGGTVADMRSIASALSAYWVDHSFVPAATGDIRDLENLLEPYHSTVVPVLDHWGHFYSYESDRENYSVVSFGKDGVDGADITPLTRFEFERDIIISNGKFVNGPQ